jgi:excinuclease UvrABC nuclease subunit
MVELKWSEWRELTKGSLESVPESPGIYEIRTDYDFGRLKDKSNIVYVGRTGQGRNLKKRLSARVNNPGKFLSRAERFLLSEGHFLEFRFAVAECQEDAKRMEAERLAEYDREYWELPPGNSALPKQR